MADPRETKVLVRTTENEDHDHELFFPDGVIPQGYYETSTTNGHRHDVWIEDALEPGDSVEVVTSGPWPRRSEFDRHGHRVTVEAVEDGEGTEIAEGAMGDVVTLAASGEREFKTARGGRLTEHKQVDRDGIRLGLVSGYLSTWDADSGGIFGVPDQFVRGAWLRSLAEHRDRGDRMVRLKDQHGRVIGGFPIAGVREDDFGLFAEDGEINLETQLGREAYALVRQGVLVDFSVGYNSIDDSIDAGVRRIFRAQLWEASIVDEPANRRARITEVKQYGTPFGDLPLAPRGTAWEPGEAWVARVGQATGGELKQAFVWFDGEKGLAVADVVEGKLAVVGDAVLKAAGVLARGELEMSPLEQKYARRHLERYLAKMNAPSPFDPAEREFYGVAEAKAADVRALETMLRQSGAFSKGAARCLAARLTPADGDAYPRETMRTILRDLQESKAEMAR